jgi:hypothetical protein
MNTSLSERYPYYSHKGEAHQHRWTEPSCTCRHNTHPQSKRSHSSFIVVRANCIGCPHHTHCCTCHPHSRRCLDSIPSPDRRKADALAGMWLRTCGTRTQFASSQTYPQRTEFSHTLYLGCLPPLSRNIYSCREQYTQVIGLPRCSSIVRPLREEVSRSCEGMTNYN